MIKKVFKTTAIVVLMALMSATSFAQSNDGQTALVKLDVTVHVPLTVDITKFEATITWHYYSTTETIIQTATTSWDGEYLFDLPPFFSNGDPSYVDYKIYAKDYTGKIVIKTCGTFDIIIGGSNHLIISSWNNCPFEPWIVKDTPASTD